MAASLRRFLLSCIVVGFGLQVGVVLAQDDDTPSPPSAPVITGFAVMGNRVTKPEIILREVTLQVGDTIDTAEIEFAKSRIYSLGLFNRVEITWPPMDSTILLIEVDERWFLYPVPLVGIVDRNWDHWYYGLGVKHENFRGRNEKIFGGFVLGYNPWVSLSYSNPWIFGDDQLFTQTGFSWSKVVNKSRESKGEGPNFDEIHYSASQMLGKRLDAFRSIWLFAAYNYIEVTENRTGRTINDMGIDRYLTVGFGASHDTRNLIEYPTSGIYGSVYIAKKGFGIGMVDMLSYQADARVYKLLYGDLSLAMRAFARLNSGPAIPNYEHQYFGFSERIRGHFYEEIEGENSAGAFLELRIPILPRFYIHVPQVPIRQFQTWKLGIYAALFGDVGTVWNKDERPEFSDMPRGYGAGLHFLFPYGIVLRIDRAWSESRRGEWIIDVGTSF
ncbi:BamA/TamA family outer membrane protein [bacterium]|nr:BamA/TamA family outer membrane protein [bacterium]